MTNEVLNPSYAPETRERCKSSKTGTILYIDDNKKENNLVQFINKAIQHGLNCLDLSKRNLIEFPLKLLEFTSMQVSHFEYSYFDNSLLFSTYI